MKWGSTLSLRADGEAAIGEAAEALAAELGGAAPDLLIAFVSPHHARSIARVPALLAKHFPDALLVGGSAGGVIGAGHEAEQQPAFSLTGAVMPGVMLRAFSVAADALQGLRADASSWPEVFPVAPALDPQFIVLPDPHTVNAELLLTCMDAVFPAAPKIGGLLSGASAIGSNVSFLGSEVRRSGAVCLALTGDVAIETIVAQGCRPIGEPQLITSCQDHRVFEIGGRKPRVVLEELFESLSPEDRRLFRSALLAGIEMKDQREYHAGDFLMRNILGLDAETGALVIGALPKPWQVIQFHVRDAVTSRADLIQLLERRNAAARAGQGSPSGALLFSCLGRGTNLYGRPDHDTDLFRSCLGPVPLGGFFCSGEIGPVGGQTFLHGYTSAFGLFRGRSASS